MSSVSQIQLALLWQQFRELQKLIAERDARDAKLIARIDEQERRIARLEMLINTAQPQFSDN